MPGGDRTGPLGAGPRTGRAAGYCAGNTMPGYANPIRGYFYGQGAGRGFRRGMGRCSGHGFRGYGWQTGFTHPAANVDPYLTHGSYSIHNQRQTDIDEIEILKTEERNLTNSLKKLRNRIEQLEAGKKSQVED